MNLLNGPSQSTSQSKLKNVVLIPLGIALLAAALIAGLTRLPEFLISHLDLITTADLSNRVTQLDAAREQDLHHLREGLNLLERTLKSEQQEASAELQIEIQRLNERIALLGNPVNQPIELRHRPVQFLEEDGKYFAEHRLSITSDSILVVTAYAEATANPRDRRSSLGIDIHIEGHLCGSDKGSGYKTTGVELFASASCIKRLSSREGLYSVKAVRNGEALQTGHVYLQCLIFKEAVSLADSDLPTRSPELPRSSLPDRVLTGR